jgi:plasmid stabilization system protein ParE
MANYKFSKAAEQDIENILDYSYLSFGEKVAENYFANLKECLQILSENPLIGINGDSLRKGSSTSTPKSYYFLQIKNEWHLYCKDIA